MSTPAARACLLLPGLRCSCLRPARARWILVQHALPAHRPNPSRVLPAPPVLQPSCWGGLVAPECPFAFPAPLPPRYAAPPALSRPPTPTLIPTPNPPCPAVLAQMKRDGIQPVTRTFNTAMIACNTSNQWQESLRVYEELLASGQPPNTTTFNAVISAHSKGGDLPRVLQTFREMVQQVGPSWRPPAPARLGVAVAERHARRACPTNALAAACSCPAAVCAAACRW